MHILIARHGETDWNVAHKIQGSTDTPLNENGLAQAQALCRNLKNGGYNITHIFSSFQKRAHATAETVGKGFGVPVSVIRGLEEMSLGVFEAHSWDEVMAQFPDEYDAFQKNRRYHVIREGESYQLTLERFFRALDEALSEADNRAAGSLTANCEDDRVSGSKKAGDSGDSAVSSQRAGTSGDSAGDILLVTHGGVMMPILALRDNVPFDIAWKRPIPNAEPVVFTRGELEAIRAKV